MFYFSLNISEIISKISLLIKNLTKLVLIILDLAVKIARN